MYQVRWKMFYGHPNYNIGFPYGDDQQGAGMGFSPYGDDTRSRHSRSAGCHAERSRSTERKGQSAHDE
ncbi:MAG: hypothetical protein ABIN91_09205 [Mucilaginibacter sp.]|uniref:hypothetical protein n=1 Tax=Mucilaginibacter sp. TaxID=1882438 RepID=UPI0032653310